MNTVNRKDDISDFMMFYAIGKTLNLLSCFPVERYPGFNLQPVQLPPLGAGVPLQPWGGGVPGQQLQTHGSSS